jgi:hypothetical protein
MPLIQKTSLTQSVSDSPTSVWRLITPARLWLYGWITYFLIYLFAPVEFNTSFIDITAFAVILFIGCNVAFLLGDFFARLIQNRRATAKRVLNARGWRVVFYACLALALAGATLRFIDRYVVRGLSTSGDLYEKTNTLVENETTLLGVLAGPLFPFLLLIPFVYIQYARRTKFDIRLTVICAACFLSVPVEFASLGSRSTLLLALSFAILIMLDAGFIKPNVKAMLLGLAFAIVSIIASGLLFLLRLQDYGISASASAGGGSAYAETVPLTAWALTETQAADQGSVLGQLVFSASHFCQYYLHGAMEYFRLIDEFDETAHGFGRYTFFLSTKLVGLVINVPPTEFNPRAGVFTTFFGPLFVDFGTFSFMFVFLIGMLSRALWRACADGSNSAKPFFFILAIAIFFMPVVDMTSSSVSSYLMASALLFAIGTKLLASQSKYYSELAHR